VANTPTAPDYVLPTPNPDEIVELKSQRALDERALGTIFTEARTANGFIDRKIPHQLLDRALDLALFGPTSANSLPLRIVFVESAEAKAKLKPALSEGNVEKTMSAPVTAIIAADLKFFEHFPRLFPERAEMIKGMFESFPAEIQRGLAWDNSTLQMAYFIVALRSLGLDAGPMAGFERPVVDAAFFPEGRFVSQFLVNIGYGDDTKVFPRLPRFGANDIAQYA
jgi:3-hydroxypropanoate dehydrogenase